LQKNTLDKPCEAKAFYLEPSGRMRIRNDRLFPAESESRGINSRNQSQNSGRRNARANTPRIELFSVAAL
jgi:hypothetical protein